MYFYTGAGAGGRVLFGVLTEDMRVWEVTREQINQPLTNPASLLFLSLFL